MRKLLRDNNDTNIQLTKYYIISIRLCYEIVVNQKIFAISTFDFLLQYNKFLF